MTIMYDRTEADILNLSLVHTEPVGTAAPHNVETVTDPEDAVNEITAPESGLGQIAINRLRETGTSLSPPEEGYYDMRYPSHRWVREAYLAQAALRAEADRRRAQPLSLEALRAAGNTRPSNP